MQNNYFQVMLVTNKNQITNDDYLDFVIRCVKTGITSVQLREKNLNKNELYSFGLQLQKVLQPYNIPLIINDNVRLAKELDAAGVHLGQTDGDVITARKILGSGKIIGLTVDSDTELLDANNLHIDYVGIGAIFPTKNKNNIKNIWGVDGLKKLISISKHPIVAIGGITKENVIDVVAVGARGVAAIDAFNDVTFAKITKNLFKRR